MEIFTNINSHIPLVQNIYYIFSFSTKIKMDSHLLPWNLIVPLTIIFFFINKWKKSKPVCVNLPPGPKKLPIIGNLHQISEPPFRCFRDLATQYGPIMHVKLGEVDAIVVSSPEIAK